MTSAEFTELFDTEVVTPLVTAGFKIRGKMLYWMDEERCLCLIRLGGRLQRPNAITHVACFRHNFLRDLNEKIPSPVSTEVFAYPFKFSPLAASAIPEYNPQNLSFETESVGYSGSISEVQGQLITLRTQMIHNHLPSAKNFTPERALDQIRHNGEEAWIESLWISDYEGHLENKQAQQGVGGQPATPPRVGD